MTDMMPLFGPGSRGGVDTVAQRGRKTPPADPVGPQWSRLVVKVPPACFACVRRLHAEWGSGAEFIPARRARWRRKQGDKVEEFCSICAEATQTAESAARAALAAALKVPPARRTVQYRRKAN